MDQEITDIKIETTQTLDTMLHQILNQALVAIDAEAGSLMLVANKRGILQIKARLGKPRSGRTREQVYKIGDNSIASWVVQHGQSYLCRDIENDPCFAPSRSGRNFLSLLSVPVIHEDKVIAVINADAPERSYFTEKHREILEYVAQQVAIPIAERISILDALAEVGVELSRLPSEGGVEPVLEKIAQLAVRSLGADVVTLYQYIQDKDEFPVAGTGPTIYPQVRDSSPMRRKVYPRDVPWIVVKERKSGFYSDVLKEDFLTREVERHGDMPRPRFVEREGIKSMAALLLPYRAAELQDEEVVGVMFANYRTHHEFNIDEISALATFADYAASAILNARREQQRRTEQIRMVETISANFAHRMGNLVGPSRVAAQMLKKRIDPTDEIALRQLEQIERKANVLFELAEKLLKPFKKTGRMFELSPLDIAKMIEEEVKRTEPHSKHITIKSEVADHLPKVQSVEFQLQEVLHDILNNAIEAMAKQDDSRVLIKAWYNERTNCVEVEISDNGPGIRDDIRDQLFTLGVTTKGSLGIGLWWSRAFMQATGGDLILRDTFSGKGTTFAIEIPCVNNKQSTLLMESANKREMDILIVDDNPDWRNTLKDILEPEGFLIQTVTKYSEASNALKANHFKLVVLDIRLVDADTGNKDGLRLLTDIDRTAQDTKAIIFTSYESEEDRQTAEKSPKLARFINKTTFDASSFSTLVRQVIDRGEPI